MISDILTNIFSFYGGNFRDLVTNTRGSHYYIKKNHLETHRCVNVEILRLSNQANNKYR